MTNTVHNPLSRIVPRSVIDRRRHWYVIRALNIYRLTLSALLLGVFYLDEQSRFFGAVKPGLFLWAASIYVLLILLSITSSCWRRPSLSVQIHVQAVIDLVALSVMIHASGGISSNLSIVLTMVIAANGILLPFYSILTVALLAFFSMLGEWLYVGWDSFVELVGPGRITVDRIVRFFDYFQPPTDELGRIGILGATFFLAALTTYTLAERARRSEELARQRSVELLEMAELNQAIVQHLQSGIIVVDSFARIRLMNDTACDLLNHHESAQGVLLSEVSQLLSQRLATWLSAGMYNPRPFRQDEHLPDITPSFSHLGGDRSGDTLIFLEDSAQVAQRLQQIKLAALGRLTAGIAHEIRNPLASISHAAQLLNESSTVSAGDRRLGQIIHDNAKRANTIIANVLDLSRRDKAKPEDFELKPWLESFCREFFRAQGAQAPRIEIRVQPEELTVRFDTSHFYQILWNLCSNACIHGTLPKQTPHLHLLAAVDSVRSRPYLEVIDFGPGISEIEGRKIFEPFFTTKSQGTGLGLYISREMCEANRAQLQYIRPAEGGCCFRITFANPSKHEKRTQWKFATP